MSDTDPLLCVPNIRGRQQRSRHGILINAHAHLQFSQTLQLYFQKVKPWRMRLLTCAENQSLTTMLHINRLLQEFPLQPSGKNVQPEGSGRHTKHGCVYQLTWRESETQSLSYKSLRSRYRPECPRQIDRPFGNGAWSNNFSQWIKYSRQWGPVT